MEINQYIDRDDLPPGPVLLENYPELNLEPKKGCNYYYEKLLQGKKDGNCPNLNKLLEAYGEGKDQCQISVNGNGDVMVRLPNHDTWEEFEGLDEATQKLIKKHLSLIGRVILGCLLEDLLRFIQRNLVESITSAMMRIRD